mgnify:CR=1 FL=1
MAFDNVRDLAQACIATGLFAENRGSDVWVMLAEIRNGGTAHARPQALALRAMLALIERAEPLAFAAEHRDDRAAERECKWCGVAQMTIQAAGLATASGSPTSAGVR